MDGLVRHVKQMARFRVFKDLPDDQIKAMLVQDKQREPKRIPYYFNVSRSHPGNFALWYLPTNKPKKEVGCAIGL